jgi:hypothetical protein
VDTAINRDFADGAYRFWLPMPQVIAAEREMARRDAEGNPQPHSIFAVFHDLGAHLGQLGEETVLTGPSPALLSDAHAVIRNALIGGADGFVDGASIAVGGAMARELVATYCYPARPAIHDLGLAWEVLRAAIYGIDPKATGSKKKDGDVSDPPPS